MLMTWHTKFSFAKSAADLENDRLRKQIDDAAEIMQMIVDGAKRPTEPAFYMWRYHLPALVVAGMSYSMEWTFKRGFGDKTFWAFKRCHESLKAKGESAYVPPPWFRDPDICRSHRSHLMAAEPEAYDEDLWPGTPPRMPILWPVVGPDGAVAELRVAKVDLPLIRSKKLLIPADIKSKVVNL